MGSNRPCFSFSAQCREGFNSDTNDLQRTASRVWGAGISGFNTSFRLADFPEGLSNLVALDEIRSGISPIDPRGTWALGMVGASITAGFTGGPNNAVIGDGINSCGILKLTLGDRALNQMRMPCQTAAMQANFSAGARSLHVGIVNVLKLDGSVEAVSDQIDLQTWVGIHSKDSNLVERLFAL